MTAVQQYAVQKADVAVEGWRTTGGNSPMSWHGERTNARPCRSGGGALRTPAERNTCSRSPVRVPFVADGVIRVHSPVLLTRGAFRSKLRNTEPEPQLIIHRVPRRRLPPCPSW